MTEEQPVTGMVGRLARRAQARRPQDGFTLIELLVVIIILGILAAVVVFAVGGVGDKGEAAAREIDERTLRTAQEAYFAINNRYGTEAELVAGGLLSEESSTHKIYLNTAAGSCGAGSSCDYTIGDQDEPNTIVVYNGRSTSFVNPIVARFTAATGIAVTQNTLGTGDKSTALANQIVTEGASTTADVFWSQDPANLGKVSRAGLFAPAPPTAAGKVIDPAFQSRDGDWVATSNRVRVLARNPGATFTPTETNLLDVDDAVANFGNRLVYDPNNASFQNFVAAMIVLRGETATSTFLTNLKAAGLRVAGNRVMAAHIANDTDPGAALRHDTDPGAGAAFGNKVGFINHYYRYQESGTPTFVRANVVNTYPISEASDPDPAVLASSAGVGVLGNTDSPGAAEMFVKFLLSENEQTLVRGLPAPASPAGLSEYAVVGGIDDPIEQPPLLSLATPNTVNNLDLNDLDIDAAVARLTTDTLLPFTAASD
ncbi:MAG: extracellular solute-binding protein [Acidimicrobiales bacterium]